jgi:deoxyhypusine synthase
MKPVKQIEIKGDMGVNELIEEMDKAGVMGAGRIGRATRIIEEMIKDKETKVFLGIAGALVPGGQKKILIDLLRNKLIDVLVTTGANLTHDLIEALGYNHYVGSANVDDKVLHEKNLDRIYETFMPNEVYEGMEDFFKPLFPELESREMDIQEFLSFLGSKVPKEKDDSILKAAYESNIPIFCPAISDSGIGLMIWGYIAQGKKIKINAFDDLKKILDIAWTSKKNGIIYLGGGVPKNYIQQSLQFSKGASYGVQITMDRPEPGGSSGAELREGISWGKMNSEGKFVDVISDVTIAFPLIYAGVKARLGLK